MKNLLLIMGIVILFAFTSDKEEQVIIPEDSIRFRVISNSDDNLDLREKNILKSFMEKIIYELIEDAKDKSEVDNIIKENFEYLNEKVQEYLKTDNYSLDYGINYFPKKVYKGVVYDEGYYNSLVITLGNGKGSNWWCVLFPPLCLLEENNNTKDVEYQFFVSRIINNFK